jgi:hypothetical protein
MSISLAMEILLPMLTRLSVPTLKATSMMLYSPLCLCLLTCLKYRTSSLTPALASWLHAIRRVGSVTFDHYGHAPSLMTLSHTEQLARLYEEMARPQHKKALSKYMTYILFDYISKLSLIPLLTHTIMLPIRYGWYGCYDVLICWLLLQ